MKNYTAIVCLLALTLTACNDAELAADLDTKQESIDALEATVADLEARLAAMESAGYLTEETDPVATTAGYLLEEADPGFTASAAATIDTTDVDAWNATAAEVDGTSDAVANSRLDDLEAEDLLLGADLDALSDQLDTLQADLDTAELDLDTVEGSIATLQVDLGDAVDAIDTLETGTLGLISTDTTLVVADPPGTDEFATVHDALDWLDGYAIERDVTVQIAIDGGTWTYDEPIFVQHRDGARVQIVGDPLSSTTLQFPLSDGIVVDGGSALGLLADLALVSTSVDEYSGLTVTESSSVVLGDMAIEDWSGNGILVTQASSLDLSGTPTLAIEGCEYGVYAEYGGHANVAGAQATGNEYGFMTYGGTIDAEGSSSTGIFHHGSGYYSYGGGFIDARSSEAIDHDIGFQASTSGSIYASGAEADSNDETGFLARQNGYLYAAGGSESSNNGGDGFLATIGGVVYAADSFASNNGTSGYASWANSLMYAPTCDVSSTGTVAYHSRLNGFIYVNNRQGLATAASDDHPDDFMYGVNVNP